MLMGWMLMGGFCLMDWVVSVLTDRFGLLPVASGEGTDHKKKIFD
jgi:hypothetical protein